VFDPVAQGFVVNMANPGGNITGFASYEFTIGGKWLELLKELEEPESLRGPQAEMVIVDEIARMRYQQSVFDTMMLDGSPNRLDAMVWGLTRLSKVITHIPIA
jgi:phage terminase large subunit-like protein